MKFSTTLVFAVPVFADFDSWSPPGPGDVRAPCPMLNSLANHGFLPHSGKDITEDDVVNGLASALNLNESASQFLFQKAVTTNPVANASTFSLSDLSNHNILEHDASLSRADFFWGDDHTFNQSVFDETRSYWTDETIDIQMAANARMARLATSNATNPTYSMSSLGEVFSLGETAAYIIALGDRVAGTVSRCFVEYLFENERLPLELGWSRPTENIDLNVVDDVINRVVNASTSDPAVAARLKRGGGGMHGF